MMLSAYYVETSTTGFATAAWAATTRKYAFDLAKALSIQLEKDRRYPNAFWVIDSRGRALAKWHKGKKYEPDATV